MKVRFKMTLKMFCAPILALSVFVQLARAQQADIYFKKPANAALVYWPAFWQMETMPESDVKIIDNWRDTPLDDHTIFLIDGNDHPQYLTSFGRLHAGALAPTCDWGLDLTRGPYVLLPHFNPGKRFSLRGCLRIRYDLHQKHWAAAVEDTRDVLMFAQNLAAEPIMISRMVRFGIEQDAVTAISMGLDRLDADALKQLSAMLDALPAGPTESDSIKLEAQIIPGWAIGKIADAGAHPDWQTIFGFLRVSEGKPAGGDAVNAAVKAAGGTPESVTAAIRSLLAYYDEAEKLVALPLTQDEFRQKAEELRHRFDTNPFAEGILPTLPAAHDSTVAAATRLILLKAAIAVVQKGPDAAKAFQDPVNHQPFAYEKQPAGFRLISKVTYRNEPVTLTVGDLK
jgi:hypothetical protein